MAKLELELGAEEQARLTQEARRAGVSVSEWARRRLFGSPPVTFTTDDGEVIEISDTGGGREREARLVSEYHGLTNSECRGRLSASEAQRLRQVEAELDEIEARDPLAQAMDRRLQETGSQLTEILELLRAMPKASEQETARP